MPDDVGSTLGGCDGASDILGSMEGKEEGSALVDGTPVG